MLNLIRADLFRMIKSKSTWVILLIVFLGALGTLALSAYFIEADLAGFATADQGSGLTITIPEDSPAFSVTSIKELVESFFTDNTGVMFIIVFTVLFTGGNIRTGYNKNIAGVVGHKYKFVLSEALIICLFTALTIILLTCAAIIGGLAFFDNLTFTGLASVLPFLGLQLLLRSGLGLVVAAFTEISRSNLISLLVWVIYSGGFGLTLISLIDGLVNRRGFITRSIAVGNYSLTGNLMILMSENMADHWVRIIIVVAVISGIALISGTISKEVRDMN